MESLRLIFSSLHALLHIYDDEYQINKKWAGCIVVVIKAINYTCCVCLLAHDLNYLTSYVAIHRYAKVIAL